MPGVFILSLSPPSSPNVIGIGQNEIHYLPVESLITESCEKLGAISFPSKVVVLSFPPQLRPEFIPLCCGDRLWVMFPLLRISYCDPGLRPIPPPL